MNTELIRKTIESYKKPNGLTQFATDCECSPALVYLVLNGHEPSVDVARRFAKVCKVSLDKVCESKPVSKKRK